VTASVFETERSAVLAAGCDDFVHKPFRVSEIFDMMRKHLRVQYIYEEDGDRDTDESADTTDALSPAALAALPAELRDALKNAVAEIDRDMIDELLAKIRSHNAALADGLAEMAADYRYEEILNIIQS